MHFSASSGKLLPDSARLDAGGHAETLWFRTRGAEPALIGAEVSGAGGTATQWFELTPTLPAPAARHQLVRASNEVSYWFEKAPLRYPLVVEIRDASGASITERDVCAARQVIFSRVGSSGAVTPDTSFGRLGSAEQAWKDSTGDACFAQANWTLGEGTGYHHVRARLVTPAGLTPPPRSVEFEALARAIPRLVAGFAAVREREYLSRRAGKETVIRVERPGADGGTVAYDSTVTGPSGLETAGGRWGVAPVAGISAAIVPRWRWLTAFGGLDVQTPATDWYAGLSLLRLGQLFRVAGVASEAVLIDVHILTHWGRINEIRNPGECLRVSDCDTNRRTRFRGAGGLVTIDAGSLLSDVIKKLGT